MKWYFDDEFFSINDYRLMILEETDERIYDHTHPFSLQDELWDCR